jgi:hypothetical protein
VGAGNVRGVGARGPVSARRIVAGRHGRRHGLLGGKAPSVYVISCFYIKNFMKN